MRLLLRPLVFVVTQKRPSSEFLVHKFLTPTQTLTLFRNLNIHSNNRLGVLEVGGFVEAGVLVFVALPLADDVDIAVDVDGELAWFGVAEGLSYIELLAHVSDDYLDRAILADVAFDLFPGGIDVLGVRDEVSEAVYVREFPGILRVIWDSAEGCLFQVQTVVGEEEPRRVTGAELLGVAVEDIIFVWQEVQRFDVLFYGGQSLQVGRHNAEVLSRSHIERCAILLGVQAGSGIDEDSGDGLIKFILHFLAERLGISHSFMQRQDQAKHVSRDCLASVNVELAPNGDEWERAEVCGEQRVSVILYERIFAAAVGIGEGVNTPWFCGHWPSLKRF